MSIEHITERETALMAELATLQAKVAFFEKQAPVAWAARHLLTKKYAYIWHTEDDVRGWINLQHQSQDNLTYHGPVPLFLAAGARFRKQLTTERMTELIGDELDSSDAAFINFGRRVEAEHGATGDPA